MKSMKPVVLFFAFVCVSFGAAKSTDQAPQVQAKLLDHNGYSCANCFFGASTYYFCFEAGRQVLIGYEKIPTMNWTDSSTNWLTKVHRVMAARIV